MPRPFSGLWQLFFSHPFAGYDLWLWQTFPVYVTSTYFPLSSSMTILNFMSHSRRLQFPDPLKNGAEIIFREFSFRTWLFFKRKLHQGLLSCKPRLKIVVQAPPNKRPPPGKRVISIMSQSSSDSLNFVFKPSISTRRKRCPPSESFQTSSYREEKYNLGFVHTWRKTLTVANGHRLNRPPHFFYPVYVHTITFKALWGALDDRKWVCLKTF